MFNDEIKFLIDNSINESLLILRRNMIKYHKSFPYQCATNGIYGVDNGFWSDWHPGLYAGIYWIAYELCGDIKLKKYAESLGDILYSHISQGNIWHSDMGLVYLPCVLPDIYYNKSKTAKQIIVMASDCLVEKMAQGGRFTDITYFNFNAHRARQSHYISQVTYLCNIHLLSLASEISGNSKYISLAENSVESVFKYNISSSGKVIFRCTINKDDLKIRKRVYTDKMQCTQDDHRGYSWALWNLAKCYALQKKDIFLERFIRVLDYVENSYFDNMLYKPNSEILNSYYDSSAAAIAMCGLLEMAENSDARNELRKKCLNLAQIIFLDICKNSICSFKNGDECFLENGYKLYSDEGYRSKTSGTIPGDYFWLQSLNKLKKLSDKGDQL